MLKIQTCCNNCKCLNQSFLNDFSLRINGIVCYTNLCYCKIICILISISTSFYLNLLSFGGLHGLTSSPSLNLMPDLPWQMTNPYTISIPSISLLRSLCSLVSFTKMLQLDQDIFSVTFNWSLCPQFSPTQCGLHG